MSTVLGSLGGALTITIKLGIITNVPKPLPSAAGESPPFTRGMTREKLTPIYIQVLFLARGLLKNQIVSYI